jgi:hypothetical protein
VLSGVSEGDELVIADVSAAIPTNSTGGLRGLGGGGFVRNGNGGPAGGPPAGAGTVRNG